MNAEELFLSVAIAVLTGVIGFFVGGATSRKETISRAIHTSLPLVFMALLFLVFRSHLQGLGLQTAQGFGESLGELAHVSYLDGGEAHRLDGQWHADWTMFDQDGQERFFEFKDEAGQIQKYPIDTIDIKTFKSTVSATSRTSRVRNLPYWLEGRFTRKDVVTLQYWSPLTLAGGNLAGVVILEAQENWDKNPRLSGQWIGWTADGQFTRGRTEWWRIGGERKGLPPVRSSWIEVKKQKGPEAPSAGNQ